MLKTISRFIEWWCIFTLFLVLLLMSDQIFSKESDRSSYNMPKGATSISADVYDLHMDMFWWCVCIAIVVFGVMFYSMIVHRKTNGRKAANFHESTALEFFWTLIPLIILSGRAYPATTSLVKLYDTSESEVDILVTGYQWFWKYEYLGQDVSFFSRLSTPQEQIYNKVPKGDNYLLEVDSPLVIPINKKIRFLVTSNDVIHGWWVPDLAVKRDAIPGYINESWTNIERPGIYRGVCAELCGKDHGFMPIVVKAVPEAEYDIWLVERYEQAEKTKALTNATFTFDQLMMKGEEVYGNNCVVCHGINGQGGVGKAIAGSPIATGDIDAHLDIVLNGSQVNPAMTAFKDILSEADTAAVITYQRNAFGNKKGDWLQPVDVLNFKQGK